MSRDSARIKPILALLEELWQKNPNMTLGQIIKEYAIHPKELASKEDEETFLSLAKAVGRPIPEFNSFIKED